MINGPTKLLNLLHVQCRLEVFHQSALSCPRISANGEDAPLSASKPLNGIGKLFVQSSAQRDYTMTQTLVLVVAVTFIVVDFIVDILYAWLDPRIRYR